MSHHLQVLALLGQLQQSLRSIEVDLQSQVQPHVEVNRGCVVDDYVHTLLDLDQLLIIKYDLGFSLYSLSQSQYYDISCHCLGLLLYELEEVRVRLPDIVKAGTLEDLPLHSFTH